MAIKLLRGPFKALTLALGTALLFSAGSASALGLLEAYDAALKNDPTFRSAYFDNEGGKEYRILGRSYLLPTLQASFNGSRNVTDISEPDGFGGQVLTHPKYISRYETLELRQSLFNLDALARYKQGIAQSKVTSAQFDSARQDLIVRVTGAYFDALYADDQYNLAKIARDMYVEQRRVNDRLFEKGEGTKTDMVETQSRLDLAEAQLLEAQDAQVNARATLAGMIGQEVTGLDGLGPVFHFMPLTEGGFETWKDLALKNNPDLQAQQAAIESAHQEINKSRAGHAPRLDFVGTLSKSASQQTDAINQDTTVRALGIQLTVPLYQGGAISAQTRQAAASYGKAQADLDAKTDKALVELRKEYNTVISSVPRINALDKAVASARLLIVATEQSIKGGVRINLDLLNAQQQLFTSQKDLANARYSYLLALMRLRAAAGVLEADDVRQVAAYFH
jgi:protease secretion system outer membrane protein